MSPNEFIRQIERTWDRELEADQALIYLRKLERFSDAELQAIFDRVIESSKYMPRIADIYSAATDLEMLAKPAADGSKSHTWERTDCKLCEGEGRLNVIMQTTYGEATASGRDKTVRFADLGPYSDKKWIGYPWQEGFNSYIFRCSCEAGEAETIPKAWPRWDPDRHRRADVEAKEPEPVPVYGMKPMAKVIRMFSEEVPF